MTLTPKQRQVAESFPPNIGQAIRELLIATRKHCEITGPLDSAPLDGIVEGITDAIWTIFDIDLQPGECNDGFMDHIFDYFHGKIDLDECLDGLSKF